MKYAIYVPLYLVMLLIYNLIMLTSDAIANNPALITIPHMAKEAGVDFRLNDMLVILGIVLLYFEILKAIRRTTLTVLDHGLSLVVFIVYLVEFIAVAGAGTSTFLILMLMALLDVMAGFTVTISTSRRDISLGTNTD